MSRDTGDHTGDQGSLIEQAAKRLRQQQPPPNAPTAEQRAAIPGPSGFPADSQVAPPHRADDDRGNYVTLDLADLKAQGCVTPDSDRSRSAEEYRIIKRPLLENAFGRTASLVEQGNLIMVTSSIPGEGKTYTAVNLAMSIAMEMDKTVLLIDADVGRPRLHKMLGIQMGPGLVDLMVDSALDVRDVILRTNVPKLRIIPMGKYHPHANELLASGDMQRLMHELASRYEDRVIIFDSPPLLVTSEAVVLSNLVGQIVFVVEAGRSLQHSVKDALGLLDASKPIGLILNKTRQLGGDYYGYGSYGGYGGYGPEGARK
ncbi:MAG: XrtA-associated tyrosine autokinase [Lamprobacter sp.]|uniref:XrtA-associated tyrosine autokinase n=1 Tax=Lamprobacter sp. TaxID=3100796 RepID=UPI002B26076F|nr:XrtA-associated tyrosine autokinase [Lamprobacter sp.]MEA3641367.1 XrtA-associated tyrosine autokinase [Lamprobacter sp.]